MAGPAGAPGRGGLHEPLTLTYAPMGLHAAFVVVYLLALIGVGALKARKIKSQEDFSLAGRGLPTWVLVGTLLATWIGTGSIFGNAEETFRVGLAAFVLPVAGGLGILVLYFLAPRIRRFGQFTIQDILEARFGVTARVLGTCTVLLAYVIIVSYQYRAGSAVVERVFGLEHLPSVLLVAGFVIVYTALAGMYSVAYTDVANGALMILGLIFALPILWSRAGGWGEIQAAMEPEQLSIFGHYGAMAWVGVLLPTFLLLLGDANMVQRFFSARDERAARRSAAWMFVGVLALEVAIIAAAFLASALVAQGKLEKPDEVGHIIVEAAFGALPSVLGALLVGTVVAIVVSTADSYLLAPATAVVRDLYQRFLRPEASEAQVVFMGRVVVVVLGLVALGLAFTADGFFRVALFAYTIYGAGITPALFAAYFWPRATSQGAVASIFTGVGVAIAWQFSIRAWLVGCYPESSWIAEVEPVLPAFVVSVLVLLVVSLSTPAPGEEQAHVI